jgi:hypothetical protein
VRTKPGDLIAAVLPGLAMIGVCWATFGHWVPVWVCGIVVGATSSFYAAALLLSRAEIRILRAMNSKLADQVFDQHSVE